METGRGAARQQSATVCSTNSLSLQPPAANSHTHSYSHTSGATGLSARALAGLASSNSTGILSSAGSAVPHTPQSVRGEGKTETHQGRCGVADPCTLPAPCLCMCSYKAASVKHGQMWGLQTRANGNMLMSFYV